MKTKLGNSKFTRLISYVDFAAVKLYLMCLAIFLLLSLHFTSAQTCNNGIYLSSTENIDCDNSEIVLKAEKLTRNCANESEKVKALFDFVRDSYNDNEFDSYKASDVLKLGGNSCHQRANLLAALCRAVNIPSRRHLQLITIKDYSFQSGKIKDLTFTHGITGIKVNDEWHLFEPVGNVKKWQAWVQDPNANITVSYSPNQDCLFEETDKIRITTIPVYFQDDTPFLRKFRQKLLSEEIGVL